MCAAEAGKRGRRILVLEHNAAVGRKILISGGGRCNFTNIGTRPENFLSSNLHFCRSALARYTPADFVGLVDRHGIPWHEKKLGQLFCDSSAREIAEMLLRECRAGSVEIMLSCGISAVRRTTEYIVDTARGTFAAPALVVATGGLSIPRIGASSLGYDLAKQFGIRVIPPRPALVPLVWGTADREHWSELAGVAADVEARASGVVFRERMLFTHQGVSGPAILQISSYLSDEGSVSIDLLPEGNLQREGNKSTRTLLSFRLPKRLADRWLDVHFRADGPVPLAKVNAKLHSWKITPAGTEGFAKAEVTAGGVHPDDLNSKTLEARNVPGLFFIGEVIDVTGHLGGYNFQWAWSSAFAAAQAL